MGILSDGDILARLEGGRLGIDPFDEAGLTPNGYDLRIAEVLVKEKAGGTRTVDSVKATIGPGEWFAVSTLEVVRLPPDVTAQLWIRSSWARKGLVAAFGKVEAGFEGTLTVGGANLGPTPVELPIGERFCQIAFETMNSRPRRLYAERSGNFQGQRGVTLDAFGKKGKA